MPRPKNPVPTYRQHRPSGQAVVTLTDAHGRRKDVYLGSYGSPESQAAYARLVARIRATPPTVPANPDDRLVSDVALAFWGHAEQHYRRADGTPTSEIEEYRGAIRVLAALYADTPANEFGPLALQAVRRAMIEKGWCRTRVNQQVGRLKRLFKWAASQELVPGSVYQSLATVGGLQRGRTNARETEPIKPVAPEHVDAVLPYLTPTVRAMVELQRLTGMRPGEVRAIKAADLDRSGELWHFRPAAHKMSYRGRSKIILMGPKAQAVLTPFLFGRKPDDYLFSAARAKQERAESRRAARKSKVQPSQICRAKPARSLKRRPRSWFSAEGYGSAISRACEKAGVPHWHPNQLRHAFATEVRKRYGLEAAQVLLGHERADVTQIYAEKNAALAAEVMREVG